MLPYFSETYGNPSSIHRLGQQAESAIERSRRTIADILNCQPKEIVFTSCGSESDNLAIRGVAYAAKQDGRGNHLITNPIEHSAVSRTIHHLETLFGFDCEYLIVDHEGNITPDQLRSALRDDTVLVSLMMANNEIGTILPIADLAAVAHENGTLFHTDAVQAAGQLDLDVQKLGIDLMSISGHKFYGPKGVGVLYVRENTPIEPVQTGGSHEHGLRSGTHNTPLIVGLAKALEIAYAERDSHIAHYQTLRDRLITGILDRIPDVELTGSPTNRLPSHASFTFKHVDGNMLLMHLDMKGIAASAGSACKTGNPEPSAVLLALGYDSEWALGGLLLTVGRQTTTADIDYVLDVLPSAIETVRKFHIPA
jgi:cysteine desulfurase